MLLWSTKELAAVFSVHYRTIQGWVRHHGLPVAESRPGRQGGNQFQSRQVLDWYAAFKAGRGGVELDYTAERARLTYHQANIAELDAEQRRGHVWPLETIEVAYAALVGNARARLLAIPGKIRNRVPGLEDWAHELLEELIREALDELDRSALPADLRGSLETYHRDLASAAAGDLEPVGEGARTDH